MMDTRTQVGAARRAVLALPRLDLATLVVTGSDRLSWLNGLLTCDLVKRAATDAAYGLAVARNGRVLSDATVLVDDAAGRVLVAVPRAVVSALQLHLEHYLVMEDAAMEHQPDAFQAWAVHGPRFADVVDAGRAAGAIGGTIDPTELGGALLLAPMQCSAEVRAAIERSAAMAGGLVGDDVGWEALRLERGVPRFGVDFDEKTYPQEASLERTAVSFDKGCYLGQEVVCMLEMRGHVKRKLVSLVLETRDVPERGAAVTDEAGAAVGEITSAVSSPTVGKAVALAVIKRAHAERGKKLVVGGVHAEVVDRPG
ncbi:MAG: folate-binding protein YgfZ [Myxococcota bacterium]|nr:folate-binding protein YgfZ [Myxococcota bacterium]